MRLRLKTRYALTLLGLTLTVVIVLSAAQYLEIRTAARDLRNTVAEAMDGALLRQYQERAVSLSTALSVSLVNAVYRLDVDEIENLVDGLSELPDLGGVAVLDRDGLLFLDGDIPDMTVDELAVTNWGSRLGASAPASVEYMEDSIITSSPVTLDGETIGYVVVCLSLSPIRQELSDVGAEHDRRVAGAMDRALVTSAEIAVVTAVLCLILAIYVGGRLSRPITSLSALARRVGQGDFQVPDRLDGPGEVGELATSFVAMAHDLRRTTVSNTYLDGILNSMLDGLVVTGAGGMVRKVNAATCTLLGHDEAELIGQPLARFLDVGDTATGRRQPIEGMACRKDGTTVPVLASSAGLAGGPDDAGSRVWVFRDITRIKETQNDLLNAKKEAEKASEAKSQFLANMSHELRTPLNAVLGFAELILDGTYGRIPRTIREAMERIERNGQHLLGLINDVLDLAKIDADRFTLSLGDYSMVDVIRTVESAVGTSAADKNIALTMDVPPDLPSGWGDERRITQALMNLVGNAIKFTDSGAVSVTVAADDRQFTVTVADTGPGIADADQKAIFDEFYQVDGSMTRRQGGAGLGLAITKRMIEMQGGQLWVTSTPGQGAAFSFTLPVRVDRRTEAA